MPDLQLKLAILAALGHAPGFSGLVSLPPPESRGGRQLLAWLDRSGLALGVLRSLQINDAIPQISQAWRDALGQRLEKNIVRTRDMVEEFERLNVAFRKFGVKAAALKGFTLVPDFCAEPSLRHQVDFDFLVDSRDVSAAAEALRYCGYTADRLSESGETCFVTPLQHIPSADDDLYILQRQRQVDLHTSLWEPCPWLPVETPQDCLEYTQHRAISGVRYLSLSLEDKFLLQVLHTFRHSFRSWIRVSWVLEIAQCVEYHAEDDCLWNAVISRSGDSRLTKCIFAFVLELANRLFHTPIPARLRSWTAESHTQSLRAWLDHFAVDWATSDWPGSLNNLFLTAEFIPDPSLRRQYWRSRLLPQKRHASIGSIAVSSPSTFLRLQAARVGYVAHRAGVHLKDIVALPRQQLRWKRALQLSRGPSFDSNS